MLEGIIAPTLERLLGQYIVDLPREQLRVGLWSGVLRLENVRLKPDAFDALKLPFAVREGTIDLLELKIAWKTLLLRSHPICVTLEGVALTASPRAEDEWAAEPAEKRALALKRAALAAAAELAATKRRGGADIADAAGSSLLAAAVPTVLDRLRVKVGAVHVKFADMPKLADDEDVAAFGLRLDSMLVATSKTEREPEPEAPAEASASGRTTKGAGDAEFADADETDARNASSPAGPSALNPRRRRQRILAGVRGVLAAVTPMSQSKKRVDIAGLRVYSRARRVSVDGSPLEWYPAPRAPGAPDRLSAPSCPSWRARCDDRVDPDDVMLGAEMLTASLTVTARERSRPATTSGASSRNAQAPGFDVRLEVLSALETRIRPSQMRSAMRLADAAIVWELRDKHGALRPVAGPGGKREWRAWWRYAARAVMRETRDAIRASPSLANVTSIAVPLISRDEGRVATVARYAELYERKLRDEDTAGAGSVGSSPAPSLSSAFDESFGEDQFFECDEDPSELEGDALELYSLESQLALEELLAARAQAERAAYANEEEDEEEDFLDAEEFDQDDDASKSSGGYFSRVTGALYKRGAGIATNAVGLATSAAARVAGGATRYAVSSGATSVFASGEASANGHTTARAAGIVVELRSFTVVFRKETSVAPATDAFALQFGGIRAELDSPDGVALRAEVQNLDGWLPSDGTDASSRCAVVWPRRDASERPDARSPAIRATQLDPGSGDTQPPLEMDIAPLNIVAHPSLAAALAPFADEVPHTHQARLLYATQRLPGSAPRERLARAVASIQSQLPAQPWKVCMSQPMFLLPSASAPDEAYAAALEVASLAAEFAAGGGVAPTAAATENLRRRAERLARREGALEDDAKEALETLERASTAHQTALTFGGARLLLPTPGPDRMETVWSAVIDGWGGSALAVSLSSSVGGPDAATRASARFAPLRATATPETFAALETAARAATALAESAATVTDSPNVERTEDATGSSATSDVDFEVSFEEMRVSLETRRDAKKKRSSRRVSTSPAVPFCAVIRGVEARVRAERNGDARADVVIRDVEASRGDEALLRVVEPSSKEKYEDDGVHFARAEFSAAASGKQRALLRACGLTVRVSDALVGDLGAFAVACVDAKAAASAANGDSTRTGSPNWKRAAKDAGRVGGVDDAATTALTLFGARGSTRSTLRVFPGGAPDGADGTIADATLAREAAWTSLALGESEQYVRAASTAFARLASENPDASAFAFAARSASSVVLASSEASAASRFVSTVDLSGVAATLRSFQGEDASEKHVEVDVTLETVRARGATSASANRAVLDFGVCAKARRVTDDADAPLSPQTIDVRVSRARVGAHADFVANVSRWFDLASAKWAKSTSGSALERALASPSSSPAEPKSAPEAASFGSARLVLVVEETSVFIPGSATDTSSREGAGFLFVVGNASFATRFPLDDATLAKDAPAMFSAFAANARALFLTRKDEEWASALRAPPADASTTCPVVFEVASMRVREQEPADGTSFVVDIPLVRLVATPGVVASAAEAAARFAAVAPAPAAPTDAERDARRDDADTAVVSILGSVDVRVGRASVLLHSSETRSGGYGARGDEVAALVTASALRFAADVGDADGVAKTKRRASVEMSFESIHALDVSGTLAGEAERMATGDALGDRAAEAGVPLAWIGSTGGKEKRSVVSARAEGNVFFGFVPENADVDVTLSGGGFVADVPAWDRVATLAGVLAKTAAGSTVVLALEKSAVEKPPERKKSVTFADQRKERATESSGASFAFASGDWTMTIPWNPPDAGARALLLSLSARASASAVIDVHLEPDRSASPSFDPKSWRADARAGSVTLALRETAKDVSGSDAYALSSSPVFEMRGFGCEVHSDGSEWHEGVAFDVVAGDITLLVSQRRLTRMQEAARVLQEFGAESSAAWAKNGARSPAAAKPSAAAKRATAETPFFASAPAVSASLTLGVMGLLVLDDERTGTATNIGPSLLEGAVLGVSASATFDPKERRASMVAEARTLLDALAREKGAWEPVVEPWRVRLGADASFRADGAPSKIEVVFTGVDALEITVGEAGAAAAAAAARALAAGREDAAPPPFSRTYWLHNATNVAAEYELDGVDEEGAHDTGIRGTVAPGARVSIQFPGTETRAAPRYARVGGVEPRTTPAPAPKPARRRAVVVRFLDGSGSALGSPPTPPIELDAFGVFELAEASSIQARVVAEVRRLADDDDDDVDANDASLRVSGVAATRTELLLRSDLAFHNATLSPVELDLTVDGVEGDRTRVDPVRVEAGSRLWLPVSLADERARARWRPAKLAGAESDGIGFGWSEPFSLRAVAERRVVPGSRLSSLPSLAGGESFSSVSSLASSSDPPETNDALTPVTPTISAATTTDPDGTATPFACVVSGRSDPRRLAAVVALAPQLYVTNALAVPVTVSASAAASAGDLARIVAPGDTVALHDAALDPRAPITVHARPRGFTHCESVAVPPSATASPSAAPFAFEAFREVFAVRDEDDAFPNAPAFSNAPVSVRVSVAVDGRGARRVAVSAPARALNATETPLFILAEPDAPPDPESLALGLALDTRRGPAFLSAGEAPARSVASPGEGDCLVPPARVAKKSGDAPASARGVGALLRAESGVRSPVPARTRSLEISHVDYSPEGRTRANLLLADGARPSASSPATAVFRQSSDRAVSPLKPPLDVSVASPTSASAPLRRTESKASARPTDAKVPGVAMFGRSDAWHLASSGANGPISALVRMRAADSSWWSSSARLAAGDAPRVVKLPVASRRATNKKRWTQCDEYVASLVLSDVVGDAAAPPLATVSVTPRFTVRSRVNDHALFFRQPGSEATKTVPPFGEAVASRWSDAKRASSASVMSRDLAFRPALPGIWSWSAPVAIDRPGVTHVTVSDLHADEGRAAKSGTKSFRAYRVVVSASRETPGGFAVEVFELGKRDAAAFRPPPRDAPECSPEPQKAVSRRLPIADPRRLDVPASSSYVSAEPKQNGTSQEASSPTALKGRFRAPRFRPLARAIVFAADVSRAAVKKASAPPRLAVRVAASAPSAGVSVVVDEDVHGCPRELVYARVTGLHAQVSAKGDSLETLREAEGSLALGAARLDLQTPETTSSPTVFAAGATGLSALSARASAAFSETASADGLHDDELSRNIGGSWRARSFSVDIAPMTIDLREAFGSSAPRAAARLAAPFAAGAAAPPAPPFPASPAAPAPQTPHLGFQSVRVGRIDAVVSFAALPFLPAGVRSIGAVDRARVTLRAFSLPSDARAAKLAAQKSSCFFPPETVARLAARHYLAESASQIVRLVASNKLLGDPARLWAELEAATRELFSSPPKVKSATRFSRRVAAAVAAWAKTLLRHARQVTSEMEERFEAAKRRRVERLRSRRIADDEEDAGDTSIGETKRQTVFAKQNENDASDDADRLRDASAADAGVVAGVVAGVLRAAGHLVEGPLQGAELRGVPGLVEGAAEGVFGAAAATANAALALATDLADKLETYGFGEEEEDGEEDDETNEITNWGVPGARRRRRPPPRLRAPRAPPASRLEPWRPYSCE
jgi:hypothetical protein